MPRGGVNRLICNFKHFDKSEYQMNPDTPYMCPDTPDTGFRVSRDNARRFRVRMLRLGQLVKSTRKVDLKDLQVLGVPIERFIQVVIH
jgi:hypothetical protein